MALSMDNTDRSIIAGILLLIGISFGAGFAIGKQIGGEQYLTACEQVVLEKTTKAYLDGAKDGYKDGMRDAFKEQDDDGKR